MEKRIDNHINPRPHRSQKVKIAIAITAGFLSLPAFCKSAPDFDQLLKGGYNNLAMGNTAEALETFRSKCAKYPDSAACHTACARALKRLGKFSDAKAEFKRATECDANYGDAFYELGSVLEGDKDWDGAIRAFQRYYELKKDDAERQNIPDRIKYCQGQK